MTTWTERAKAQFSETTRYPTAKTDETPLSSVSSVGVWAVLEKEGFAQELYEAAMRLCDLYGDGIEGRADMVRDIEQTPAELRPELLDYLRHRTGAKPC